MLVFGTEINCNLKIKLSVCFFLVLQAEMQLQTDGDRTLIMLDDESASDIDNKMTLLLCVTDLSVMRTIIGWNYYVLRYCGYALMGR